MSNNNNNNNNNNNFILLIKNNNREWTMKTFYYSLIILCIIEISVELFCLRKVFLKTIYGIIIFAFVLINSIIYLIFSIYYFIYFKIYSNTQNEINAKITINQVYLYKKITNCLMIIGFCITLIYFIFIFIFICLNEYILPNCEELENKNNFDKILNIKSCQYNKCYNIKVNNDLGNKDEDIYNYNYNYLCNFRLSNYLINNNDNNNKIECVNLPKIKKNNVFDSYDSLSVFYNEKNTTKSNIIYYFLISCDYDFNKYLYICNSINELNKNYFNLSDFSLIDNYNEPFNILKEEKNENNTKDRECITVSSFLLFIIINMITFFTLPIKVDIWYNENKRFEIIKKEIHPNRLRVNYNVENNNNYNYNNNYDNLSISTDNSSEKSADSSISENSQGDNNIFDVVVQN